MTAWKHAKDSSKMEVSKTIRDAGMVLAATEIRSANYYWHVRQNDESKKIYPSTYEAGVIGILWSTLAQFTTWFGNSPYLAIGIQLLPLTPISENRDASQEWLREIYAPLANSCAADFGCANEGWGVLQLAILATIGNVNMAKEHAQQIPASAFNSAGGNGHSMTNTLHYMATRPEVEPADVSGLAMPVLDTSVQNVFQVDCGVPDTCTSAVLNTLAGGYTCQDRILWLVNVQGMTEDAACTQIAVTEYPDQCGACHNVSGRA
jgi:Glycosyl hydrolase family 81 C-terminal domain